MSVYVAWRLIMSRATFYIVVRSVCCSKIKGVDVDKDNEPEVDVPGGEAGIRDNETRGRAAD